jgi:hypothetical protein
MPRSRFNMKKISFPPRLGFIEEGTPDSSANRLTNSFTAGYGAPESLNRRLYQPNGARASTQRGFRAFHHMKNRPTAQ